MLKRTLSLVFVLSIFVVSLLTGAAFAAPTIWVQSQIEASVVDGKSVNALTSPQFNNFYIDVKNLDKQVEGKLTIKNGTYSYGVNKASAKSIEGKDMTFFLKYNVDEQAHVPYESLDDHTDNYVHFWDKADGPGMYGKEFLIEAGGETVNGNIPNMITLEQQMQSYIPAIELVTNDADFITAVKWKFVNPSDPNTTLTKSDTLSLAFVDQIRVYPENGTRQELRISKALQNGDKIEGTYTLTTPIPYTNWANVRIYFCDGASYQNFVGRTRWSFRIPALHLQPNFRAAIKGGKADYTYKSGTAGTQFSNGVYANNVWLGFGNNSPAIIDLGNGKISLKNVSFTYGPESEFAVSSSGTGTKIDNKDMEFNFKYDASEEQYVPRNDDDKLVYLWGKAESGLSEKEFTMTFANGTISGKTPKIKTIEEQMASFVPYVEYVTSDNGTAITGIKWRFVNPSDPTKALVRSASVPVDSIHHIRLWNSETGARLVAPSSNNIIFKDGDVLEGTVDFDFPVKLADYHRVQVRFHLPGYRGDNSYIRYDWTFIRVDDAPDVEVGDVAQQVLDDVKNQMKLLTGLDIETVSLDQSAIKKNANTIIADGDTNLNPATVASAIKVYQKVAIGGAVVVATSLPFPAAPTSPNGTALPNMASSDDMFANWHVNKYFKTGEAIDLLAHYKDKLFRFENNKAILDAIVTIIDDSAVGFADSDMVTVPGKPQYGVTLKESGNQKYLYIFDGEKNGWAEDPIALVAKSDNGSSGSSGCTTGLPVLLLAVLPFVLRKKK
ncbi:SYNERG-CTERM sorting domain-containing protein [Synergistaceae bacterium OttesenSCG-928-I11]|nr:SYNERG-CTERM sorting domain-containing protein [Synergistaceae bacterium OttesenSCG-928-I11]